jgi:hypothetical protein
MLKELLVRLKNVLLFILLTAMNTAFSQENLRIAVLDLTADGVDVRTARTVSEMLRTELVNMGKFTVVERNQMESILKEQGVQQTGCTDQECAVQVGKLMSARKILVGTVGTLGPALILNVRIVDVERGVVEFAAKEKADSESGLDKSVERITRKLAAKIEEGLGSVPPRAPQNVMASNGDYSERVVITWKAVEDAKYYYVYRAESEEGEYGELDDTKKTSFVDKKAKPGVTYYYRIRARNKAGYGDYSAVTSGYAKKETAVSVKEPARDITESGTISVMATPTYIIPFGRLADLLGGGMGALVDISAENILGAGFRPGVTSGFWYFSGKSEKVDKSYIIPILARLRRSIPLGEPINLIPEALAGCQFASISYIDKNDATVSKSALEPLIMAGISLEYEFTSDLALQAGADYGAIYETGGIMSFVVFRAGMRCRF